MLAASKEALRRSRRGAVAFVLAVASTAGAEETAVNIEYRAPAQCPSRDAFVEQVLRRTPRVRLTTDAEAVRHFEIVVQSSGKQSRARLEFVDAEGRRVRRELTARDCDEVVAGMAVVTALAVDPRLSDVAEPSETDVSPGADASPSRPAARRESAEPPDRSDGQTTRRADDGGGSEIRSGPPVLARAKGDRWLASVGAAGGSVSDVAPVWVPSLAVFGDFGPTRNLRARTSFGYSDSGNLESAGGIVRFRLAQGGAELCPIAAAFHSSLRLRPCGGLELGALHAEGISSPRLEAPRAESSLWFAALFRLRAEADIGSVLVMEVEAQLRVPLVRHTFVFERPQTFVHQTPAVGAGILAGAAARIFQ